MIELRNLNKSFGTKQVLKNINVKLEEGKCNLIIGGSGGGKSVMLKCMVGLLEPDSGAVFYGNTNFSELSIKQRKTFSREFGMLFQGSALFDSQTVEENIRFPLQMFSTMTPNEIKDRVNFCLEKVNLENANKLYPSEISGGMKKRVAIARAIAVNPKYLFCDEPNSGLDPHTSTVIDELISNVTEEFKMTTVIITHDMNSVIEIGDNIIYLHEGQVWWEGHKQQVLDTTNDELYDFIYASKFLKRLKKV
ncbi:MAG: ATP-binding cassette domain-containing protein [Bacteroidia bacterium]|nr:ATP-binding cassette domain-containing protein [Bacteroidia bacterium]